MVAITPLCVAEGDEVIISSGGGLGIRVKGAP
jgi:hypothetical protein